MHVSPHQNTPNCEGVQKGSTSFPWTVASYSNMSYDHFRKPCGLVCLMYNVKRYRFLTIVKHVYR